MQLSCTVSGRSIFKQIYYFLNEFIVNETTLLSLHNGMAAREMRIDNRGQRATFRSFPKCSI